MPQPSLLQVLVGGLVKEIDKSVHHGVMPFPDLLGKGRWKVRATAQGEVPHMDFGSRTVAVPDGSVGQHRTIRLHEMGHVKFSRAETNAQAFAEGLDFAAFNAMEDARIENLLGRNPQFKKVLKKGAASQFNRREVNRNIAKAHDWIKRVVLFCDPKMHGFPADSERMALQNQARLAGIVEGFTIQMMLLGGCRAATNPDITEEMLNGITALVEMIREADPRLDFREFEALARETLDRALALVLAEDAPPSATLEATRILSEFIANVDATPPLGGGSGPGEGEGEGEGEQVQSTGMGQGEGDEEGEQEQDEGSGSDHADDGLSDEEREAQAQLELQRADEEEARRQRVRRLGRQQMRDNMQTRKQSEDISDAVRTARDAEAVKAASQLGGNPETTYVPPAPVPITGGTGAGSTYGHRSVGSGSPKPFGTPRNIEDILREDGYNVRCQWGEMFIHNPPLTARLARRKGLKGKKHVDRGGALRNVNRVKMDGKPFRREVKGRKRSGAILLDISGSMSVSNAQLEEAVRQCPQAVIAAYSGSGAKSGWTNGDLIILARDGKAVPDAKAAIRKAGMGGNNQVDLPALEWLVREARKNHGVPIWVSDGYATCAGYGGNPEVECAAYAFRHGIHRVRSFGQLLSEYRPQDR